LLASMVNPTRNANNSLKGPQQQSVESAIERIRKEAGKIDVLVNNAGTITEIGHAETLPMEGFGPAFDVNVMGLHRMTITALPLLRETSGVVVNAGTGAATTPMEGWAAYCSSKAAARMLTQVFAKELNDSGVQFFFLGIPPTDTDMQAKIRESRINPISKIAQSDLVAPEVPASVMAWLCGQGARELDEVTLDVRDEMFVEMMKS